MTKTTKQCNHYYQWPNDTLSPCHFSERAHDDNPKFGHRTKVPGDYDQSPFGDEVIEWESGDKNDVVVVGVR